jgi:hypothetical protein
VASEVTSLYSKYVGIANSSAKRGFMVCVLKKEKV